MHEQAPFKILSENFAAIKVSKNPLLRLLKCTFCYKLTVTVHNIMSITAIFFVPMYCFSILYSAARLTLEFAFCVRLTHGIKRRERIIGVRE